MASGGGLATRLAFGLTLKRPIANRPRIIKPPHIARVEPTLAVGEPAWSNIRKDYDT